jgi:hypothetical protein
MYAAKNEFIPQAPRYHTFICNIPSCHLSSSSKYFFSKNLLRISLGLQVWLLIFAAHVVLIGYSLSAFIALWLLISCDSCLKCKSALFTALWSLCQIVIWWRLIDGESIISIWSVGECWHPRSTPRGPALHLCCLAACSLVGPVYIYPAPYELLHVFDFERMEAGYACLAGGCLWSRTASKLVHNICVLPATLL